MLVESESGVVNVVVVRTGGFHRAHLELLGAFDLHRGGRGDEIELAAEHAGGDHGGPFRPGTLIAVESSVFATTCPVEPFAGTLKVFLRNREAGEAGTMERHVLPAGDGGIGVLAGVVAPAAPALALGRKGVGDRSLRWSAEALILCDAIGLTKGDGGDGVAVHQALTAEVAVLFLDLEEVIEGQLDMILVFSFAVMTGTPAEEAEEREPRVSGVEFALGTMFLGVPAAIFLLVLCKPAQGSTDGLFRPVRSAQLLDDVHGGAPTLFLDEIAGAEIRGGLEFSRKEGTGESGFEADGAHRSRVGDRFGASGLKSVLRVGEVGTFGRQAVAGNGFRVDLAAGC